MRTTSWIRAAKALGALCALVFLGTASLAAQDIVITDSTGVTHRFSKPRERIILLGHNAYGTILKIAGAMDKVVGIDATNQSQDFYFPELKNRPVVQDMNLSVDFEAIARLKPDLVLTTYWESADLEKKLGPEVTVLRINMGQPDTYLEDCRSIARAIGKEKEIQPYIDWVQGILVDLDRRVAKGLAANPRKPRVFSFYGGEHGMSDGPPYGTYGKANQYAGRIVERAGGISLGRNLEGDWITVDAEWVIAQKPEVIVRSVYSMVSGRLLGPGSSETTARQALEKTLLSHPVFKTTPAYRNTRCHVFDGDMDVSAWYLSYAYMTKLLHPAQCKDLDPDALRNAFWHRWLTLPASGSAGAITAY